MINEEQLQPRAAVTLASVQQDLANLVGRKDAEILELRAANAALQAATKALQDEKAGLQLELAQRHLKIKSLQQQLEQQQKPSEKQEVEADGMAVIKPVLLQSSGDSAAKQQLSMSSGQWACSQPPKTWSGPDHSASAWNTNDRPSTNGASMPQPQPLQARTDGAAKSGKVVQGAVTEDMIDWLADNVPVKDWKPFARKLGVLSNTLDDIEASNPKDVRLQRFEAFRQWKMTLPQEATVTVLLKTMEAKRLLQLARDFRAEFLRPDSLTSVSCDATDTPKGPVKDDLERFLEPFVQDHKLSGLLKDLKLCKVSVQQGQKLGGLCAKIVQEGKNTGDAVLRQMCSDFYASKSTDDEYDKCVHLWKFIEVCNVRETVKKHVIRGGVIGPKDKSGKIHNLSYSISRTIESLLNKDEATWSWKDLTEYLKNKHPTVFANVNKNTITQWDSDQKGAKSVLDIWETTTEDWVDTLYTLAVKNGRLDIAQALE